MRRSDRSMAVMFGTVVLAVFAGIATLALVVHKFGDAAFLPAILAAGVAVCLVGALGEWIERRFA